MCNEVLKKRFYLLACLVLVLDLATGQTMPQSIEVTLNKTTTVVFASSIASVDRGSRDVLAQKAKGVANVLQLKAAKVNFEETNLTVITSDGSLHHYFVRYAKQPVTYTIVAGGHAQTHSLPVTFTQGATSAKLEVSARKILGLEHKKTIRKAARFGIFLRVTGIYVEDDIMFYHVRIVNESSLPFFTDMLQFSVVDRQKVKRTAFQQVVKRPLFQSDPCYRIEGKTSMNLVAAFPVFTIPDAKVFRIDLLERDGGRHLSLRLKNRILVKASKL